MIRKKIVNEENEVRKQIEKKLSTLSVSLNIVWFVRNELEFPWKMKFYD
jgi:hypothetical protein